MRVSGDTYVSELSQNVCYIDLDEDEICHWKYIRREIMPNGKYRYYYDESELDRLRDTSQKATQRLGNQLVNLQRARSDLTRARNNLNKSDNRTVIAYARAKQNATTAKRRYTTYGTFANQALKQYKTKKITSFPRRVISKGIAKLANLFSKL